MYCGACRIKFPERKGISLYQGQQKWIKGMKLAGIPEVEPKLTIIYKDKKICLECGYNVAEGRRHKCYTRSRSSGYRGSMIVCSVCGDRKKIEYFPIWIRRLHGNAWDEIRAAICSTCLNGKPIEMRKTRYEAK
jgi:hypothetical protein